MCKQKVTFRFNGGTTTFESINEAAKEFGIGRLQLCYHMKNGGMFYDRHNRIVQFVKENSYGKN